ncbi:pentapeptide repeat-containing protein [Bradyrhizobium oligotrophicum]|uniref:pentapeptide repeat-containing protein n=1 Tax=Bradyrhizobium oligotrophicum TaxID=44255 RepID=UPI003EBFE1FD
MPEKLDAFDVAALERSLNDSSTRVSTIWVSFLIFSLYLLTAAATVTHRQLFLAEPVKLPVLNIDLPLWGFFFLAPILFVILHNYVLLQVLLLSRTATAYNAAVERAGLSPEENAALRQRLANTLFAQVFAGSPREREGWLGWLLKAMAWITLAIAPVLILLVFQFAFLPYHSHLATWTHRLLIVAELAAAFLLWPLVLDAKMDFEWARVWMQVKRTTALPLRLFVPKNGRHDEWVWFRQQAFPLASSVLFVLLSLSFATFPGEPHVNLFTGQSLSSVQCERWFSTTQPKYAQEKRNWQNDRLVLPRVDVVDDENLAKIEKATSDRKVPAWAGERTRILRARDLNCSDLSYADLRHVDLDDARLSQTILDYAKLQGGSLVFADLQGASLANADLWDANLYGADLRRASLTGAHLQRARLGSRLQNASLGSANLQNADLTFAKLDGAFLGSAKLQGANFFGAHLQGADLDCIPDMGFGLGQECVQLQGASLERANLRGASLKGAMLQGASFRGAELQGASLDGAQLQGASFERAQLQGASFDGSSMTYASFSDSYVWRARNAACHKSRVIGHKPDATIEHISIPGLDSVVPATSNEIAQFIMRSVAEIDDPSRKERARKQMLAGLAIDPANDDTSAISGVWSKCEKASAEPSRKEFDQNFDQNLADFLRELVCEDTPNAKAVARGIIHNWISDSPNRPDFSIQLARGLLGLDGKECVGTKELEQRDKDCLHRASASGACSIAQ